MGFPRQKNTRMVATSRGSSQDRNQTQVSRTGRPSYTFTTASPGKQGTQSYTDVSTLPQTPLPSRLSQNTKQSSMCYTIGPCWCVYSLVYLSIPNSLLSLLPICPPLPATISLFSKSVSLKMSSL